MRCYVIQYIKEPRKDQFFVSSDAYDRELPRATIEWDPDVLKAKRFATWEEAEAEIKRHGWEGTKTNNEFLKELLSRAAVVIMVDLP